MMIFIMIKIKRWYQKSLEMNVHIKLSIFITISFIINTSIKEALNIVCIYAKKKRQS